MPAWAITLLIALVKEAMPIAIQALQKAGVINGLEAAGIRAGTHVIQVVANTKTFAEYPNDNAPTGKSACNLVTKSGQSVNPKAGG